MFIDFGYGVDLYNAKFKNRFDALIFGDEERDGMLPGTTETEYLKFCKVNGLEPYAEETNDEFVSSDYIEFLAEVINKTHFGGEQVFFSMEDALFVPARLPANEDEKPKIPTQREVDQILRSFVNPLLEEPVVIKHFAIAEL